jgi:hypothetical protein
LPVPCKTIGDAFFRLEGGFVAAFIRFTPGIKMVRVEWRSAVESNSDIKPDKKASTVARSGMTAVMLTILVPGKSGFCVRQVQNAS